MERGINRTDRHIETQPQLSQISISKLFDPLIYQSIKGRTHFQKEEDGRKEETHHQDRTEEYIGGADTSTGRAVTKKHNPSYQYYNHLVEAERSRRQKERDPSSG